MKKLSMILALVLALALVMTGCGTKKDDAADAPAVSEDAAATETAENTDDTAAEGNDAVFAGKIIFEHFNIKCLVQGDKIFFDTPNEYVLSQAIVELTKNKILVYGAGNVDYSLEDVFVNIINKSNTTTSIS